MRTLPSVHPRASGDFSSRGRVSAFAGTSGLVLGFAFLSACATAPSVTYDLRPAYDAEVSKARVAYLDCDGVSDIVCECRRGGLEVEFEKPSPKHFDAGYTAFLASQEDGQSSDTAEANALNTVFSSIKADVEDICSYHDKEATS